MHSHFVCNKGYCIAESIGNIYKLNNSLFFINDESKSLPPDELRKGMFVHFIREVGTSSRLVIPPVLAQNGLYYNLWTEFQMH